MQRICQITGEEFEVVPQEQEFLQKMGLKMPVHSTKVREIMRMSFRNDRNLFMRKCDATGDRIMSVYREDASFPVYKYDYWVSDEWTVPEIGFDPDRDFFDQYAELQKVTPRVNLFAPYNENCDYVNAAEKNRNCYIHILSDRDEDCYYTHALFGCRNCLDCAYLYESELCYEATDCRNCYHCRMCFLCDNSSGLGFCCDMRGCKNCFFCHGLRNQEYVFAGKRLSKEDYEDRIAAIPLDSYEIFSAWRERFEEEILDKQEYKRMINTENCDGNFLVNTKNCHQCHDVEYAEDCFGLRVGANHLRDVHHSYAVVDGSELIYGNISTTESYNCHNVIGCWTSRDCAYGEFLQGCSNCIGCISLRRKKNCILNKEYSLAEFERLRDLIMSQLGENWGDGFPLRLAPFSYMDSTYRDYHELSREEVERIGWRWGVSDKLGKKPVQIIEQEKKLLARIGAPLPKNHHEERFKERVRWRKRA